MTHAHVTAGRGLWDGKLTIDGEQFPHPIRSIAWHLDQNTLPATITVEFEVDQLTIEAGPAPEATP